MEKAKFLFEIFDSSKDGLLQRNEMYHLHHPEVLFFIGKRNLSLMRGSDFFRETQSRHEIVAYLG